MKLSSNFVSRWAYFTSLLIANLLAMRALKKARRIIETEPTSPVAQHLASLVLALEAEGSFELANLYQVDLETFDLMIETLKEWRLDRYYSGKAKLFDLSVQARSLTAK